MRPFKRVKMLNADEYRVLKEAVASRKIAAGKARRAKIVLLCNQGHTARKIAERLECNESTALKWIGRFNRHGVAGLEEVLWAGGRRGGDPGGLNSFSRPGVALRLVTLDRLVAYLGEEKGAGRTRVAEVLANEGPGGASRRGGQ